MRFAKKEDLIATIPPDLRGSNTTDAYLHMRQRILQSEFAADAVITPKSIQESYNLNSNGIQVLLLRLAIEGLVKVVPVTERTKANNAANSEYRIADENIRHRIFSNRQGDFVSDISRDGTAASKKTIALEVEYADEEIAELLGIMPGAKVVLQRTHQYKGDKIIAVSDMYAGFWFVEMMPELKKHDSDIYVLMRQLGKQPFWCTETVDIMQANSIEREIFKMSPDDPSPILKILRRSYDKDGMPLDIQYLTDRGDTYRLHYSFPLFAEDVPTAVRER